MKYPFKRPVYLLPLLIFFLPVIAEGMIVHGDLSINDTQKGGRERSVYASGARYRITVTLDEEHYVYKGLSIDVDKKETDIIVEPGTESEKYDVTDGTFYRKWIWQTPALAPGTKCTVTLHGWRIRKGPGVGPAVWEEFTSTRTAELLSPIVTVENPAYDTTVSVDPGEEVIIWIKVVADTPKGREIIEHEVPVKFKAVDPDKPADNEGTDQKFDPADAVTETSSTNGKGSIRFYVSTSYGDNYRVWAWYEKAPEPSKVDTTQQSGHIISGCKVELKDTKNEYVKIGQTLDISATLIPATLTGGTWAWTTIPPTCGSGNFTAENPTTFTAAEEGCVYPQASYTIDTITGKSKESKRILVYVDLGVNTDITPIEKPTRTSNPSGSYMSPDDPLLEWAAYFDPSGKKWHVRVTKLECTGIINVSTWPASGTPNPVPGGNVTESNYKDIIADLVDYDTPGGGAGPVWHSTEASRAHENYHWNTDWMKTCIGNYWSECEKNLEKLTIVEGTYCKASEAEIDLEPLVTVRFEQFVSDCWIKLLTEIKPKDEPGAGGGGYAAGQAVLDDIIEQIKELAKNPDANSSTDDAWGTPSGLSGSIEKKKIDLIWIDNCIVENGFKVERKIDEEEWGVVATLKANSTSWTDKHTVSGKTNSYRVRATTTINATPYSNSISINVPQK